MFKFVDFLSRLNHAYYPSYGLNLQVVFSNCELSLYSVVKRLLSALTYYTYCKHGFINYFF